MEAIGGRFVKSSYSGEKYQNQNFKRVLGLEDELLKLAAFRDFAVGIEHVTSKVNRDGKCFVMCEGKFFDEVTARMFFALAKLQEMYGAQAPTLTMDKFTGLTLTTSTENGSKKFALSAIDRRTPGFLESIEWVNQRFVQEMVVDRNVLAASNTMEAFRSTKIPSVSAAVFGREHLRRRDGGKDPSYVEWLRGSGVSTVTILPKPVVEPVKPTAGGPGVKVGEDKKNDRYAPVASRSTIVRNKHLFYGSPPRSH
jgi:hypothetical protein